MSSNPREHVSKGFWDGGRRGHGTARESGGRSSGYPGGRKPRREGIRLDLDAFDTVVAEPQIEPEPAKN
jgi:hypothetical protein